MMKTTMQMAAALALGLFVQVNDAVAQQEEHVAIVIDRSGSMDLRRSDGRTRFEEAISQARQFVNLYAPTRTRYISIWTFEDSRYIKEKDFTTDSLALNTTLNRLTVGYGVTPLAGAVCDVSDALLAYAGSGTRPDAKKVLRLVSDGEENATPSSNQCYGPSSTTAYPILTRNSWQWKVRNKLKTGNANTEGSGSSRLVLDVNVLVGYISLAGGNGPVIHEYETKSARMTGTASASLSGSFFSFLEGVAAETGGTFTAIEDSSPAPVVGDTNGDYCVDDGDYDLVFANYGYSVPPADPAADLNQDRMVDYYDYSVVADNWGSGSGCGSTSLNAR